MFLAIETSTEICAVALGAGDRWEERSAFAGQRHSELLLPMIERLLADRSVALGELQGIAFGAGPGSFTGLRIACGVAQGLAFGAGLAVVGVSTLEAIAETARFRGGASKVVAALDARMGEIYVAAYEHDGSRWHERLAPAVVAPQLAMIPEGKGWIGAGNGFAAYASARERFAPSLTAYHGDVAPGARAIGMLAAQRFAAGEGVPARDAHPVYVRHRVALTTAERDAGVRQ